VSRGSVCPRCSVNRFQQSNGTALAGRSGAGIPGSQLLYGFRRTESIDGHGCCGSLSSRGFEQSVERQTDVSGRPNDHCCAVRSATQAAVDHKVQVSDRTGCRLEAGDCRFTG